MKKTFGIALVVAVLALIIDSWLRDAEARPNHRPGD
jgi:hypothetical protein